MSRAPFQRLLDAARRNRPRRWGTALVSTVLVMTVLPVQAGSAATPTAGSACPDVLLILVNGSGEKTTAPGPLMTRVANAFLQEIAGKRTTQTLLLPYEAADVSVIAPWNGGVPTYLGSISDGVDKLHQILTYQSVHCPSERYALAGYSQGAIVVHQVIADLETSRDPLQERISAVGLIADGSRVRNTPTLTLGSSSNAATGIVGAVAYPAGLWHYPKPAAIGGYLRRRTVDVCDRMDIVCDTATVFNWCENVDLTCVNGLAGDVRIGQGYVVHTSHYAPEAGQVGTLMADWVLSRALPDPAEQTIAGMVGVRLHQSVTMKNDPGTRFTWSLKKTSGTLPPGVTFVAGTTGKRDVGTFQGVPTTVGVWKVVVRIERRTVGGVAVDSPVDVPVTLTITSAHILPATLPQGQVGTPYSTQLTTDLAGNASWVRDGELPAGLTLSSSGLISGVPTTPGSTSFGVRVTSARGSSAAILTIAVGPRGVLHDHFASSQLVSSGPDGKPLGGRSFLGAVSDDGTWALFETYANSVAGPKSAVVLKNLQTSALTPILTPSASSVDTAKLSGDGNTLVYPTNVSPDPSKPDASYHTVLQDRASRAVVAPLLPDGRSTLPEQPGVQISRDGRYLFVVRTDPFIDPRPAHGGIWRYDRSNGQWQLVSLLPDGSQANTPTLMSIAPDGSAVVFWAWTSGGGQQAYRRILATGTTTQVTLRGAVSAGNVSENGAWSVSLASGAEGLVRIDQTSGAKTTYPVPGTVAAWCKQFSDNAWISNDGQRMIFTGCPAGKPDSQGLWALDLPTGKVVQIGADVLDLRVSNDASQVLWTKDTGVALPSPSVGTQLDLYVSRW